MIVCSVWITESCDGLKSSLSINKSRKHLLCKFNSSGNLYLSPIQEYINKHEECSKNCYCQYHNDINVLLATLYCICFIKRLIEESLHAGGG